MSAPALRLVERNIVAYRRMWKVFAAGFFEPLFWLFSVGIGVAVLVGDVDGVPYEVFVAPGLLASSAMNGAVFDSTFNVFFRLKYAKTYERMLATPLGSSTSPQVSSCGPRSEASPTPRCSSASCGRSTWCARRGRCSPSRRRC